MYVKISYTENLVPTNNICISINNTFDSINGIIVFYT